MSFTPTCIICDEPYYSKEGLRVHLIDQHSKEEMVKVLAEWGLRDHE